MSESRNRRPNPSRRPGPRPKPRAELHSSKVQISLTPAQRYEVEALARERDVSLAEVFRTEVRKASEAPLISEQVEAILSAIADLNVRFDQIEPVIKGLR